MFTKAFFRNVILFSVIIGGSLIALFVFDVWHTEQQRVEDVASIDSFIETSNIDY